MQSITLTRRSWQEVVVSLMESDAPNVEQTVEAIHAKVGEGGPGAKISKDDRITVEADDEIAATIMACIETALDRLIRYLDDIEARAEQTTMTQQPETDPTDTSFAHAFQFAGQDWQEVLDAMARLEQEGDQGVGTARDEIERRLTSGPDAPFDPESDDTEYEIRVSRHAATYIERVRPV